MQNNITYTAGLYLRLSKDDEQAGESVSISTQRAILLDFCQQEGHTVHDIYIDDGYSGLNFNRPGFQRMIEDIEKEKINLVITKDLSRLGRDYIMTGYYSEIYFQMKDVRYIALADDVDTLNGHNEIAPFKNILNDMYARDISKKVKNAKRQRAKLGLHIGAQPSYGYKKDPDTPGHLIVDPDAAEVIRTIYSLALQGLGNVAIAAELTKRHIVTPSYYKFQQGDIRFSHYPSVKNGDPYTWSHGTIYQILNNPVYTGTLISLKTETTDCKTKRRICVPADQQIITENAHVAIVTQEQFEAVKLARADHVCLANLRRENIFRGKLFCECCGHPLVISRKQLKERTADIYLCMYHYTHRDVCPRTHRVYHDMLYPYVLQEIQAFARSMKRRKVNSPIKDYANIQELTPEILDATIERIEISHVNYHSKPGSVIQYLLEAEIEMRADPEIRICPLTTRYYLARSWIGV